MTLAQIKTLLVGVLKGWFTNKKVLDKFSESETGELLYDSKTVGGTSSSTTDEEVTQAIQDTLTELNATETTTEPTE